MIVESSQSRTTKAKQNKLDALLVEDARSLAFVYQAALEKEGIKTAHVENGKAAFAVLEKQTPRVILLDLQLPDMNGLDILEHIQANKIETSVVVITANASLQVAVEAMRAGAKDFIVKPVTADRLLVTTRNALENSELRELVETYREKSDRQGFAGFIGASQPMQAVYQIIESAAGSRATVFIKGESGTGKEVCAEAVHQTSMKNGAPLVAINCAAIPKDLIESELFGHVKGAFTGAVSDRKGAVQQAEGGTLFLDEIGEMDINLQTKLLRFLQTGIVQRVGSAKSEKTNVRIICATNREPLEEVAAGRFREDLYYRLHVIPVRLPPLRERGDDRVLLARHFLKLYASEEKKSFVDFDSDAISIINNAAWPGNVRQMQNVVRNAVVLNNGEFVTTAMLRPAMETAAPMPVASLSPNTIRGLPDRRLNQAPIRPALSAAGAAQRVRPLAEIEKEAIEDAIEICNGNIPRAAALLEVSASTIYRKRQGWLDNAE